MKKAYVKWGVIGIGGVLLIAGAILIFFILYLMNAANDASKARQVFLEIDNKYAFEKPENGFLDRERFEIWLLVRQNISLSMEKMLDTSDKKSIRMAFKFFKQLQVYGDLLCDKLDAYQMPPKEYAWISSQLLGILNNGDALNHPEVRAIADTLKQNMKDNENGFRYTDIIGHSSPITSEQVQHALPIILRNKHEILATYQLFYGDQFVLLYAEHSESN